MSLFSYLFIRHWVHAKDIADFGLSEPAQFSFQFKSRESLRHFPEFYVCGAYKDFKYGLLQIVVLKKII